MVSNIIILKSGRLTSSDSKPIIALTNKARYILNNITIYGGDTERGHLIQAGI